MNRIELKDMEFFSSHGCFEEERLIGTHFRVDLALHTDTSEAEVSDHIADTVNYLEVYQVVKQQMEAPSHLLEHVARRVGETVMAQFAAVDDVTVKVSKLNPPLGGQMQSVSVSVEVSRR